MLDRKPYYQWNAKSKDYYVTAALREYDRLCFFIERETGQSVGNMTLYKFLSVLENIESSNDNKYGRN